MNYELPKSLKRYNFYCEKIGIFVNFNKCTTCCKKSNPENNKLCWENKLRQDIISDCDCENEKNIENYMTCPKCKTDYIVSCAFDSFLCSNCGEKFFLDEKDQKKCLRKNYKKIDEEALNLIFSKIKLIPNTKNINNNSNFQIKPKVGRNEQCPCGSGKKYKKCCGA